MNDQLYSGYWMHRKLGTGIHLGPPFRYAEFYLSRIDVLFYSSFCKECKKIKPNSISGVWTAIPDRQLHHKIGYSDKRSCSYIILCVKVMFSFLLSIYPSVVHQLLGLQTVCLYRISTLHTHITYSPPTARLCSEPQHTYKQNN